MDVSKVAPPTHFQAEEIWRQMRHSIGDLQQIVGPDARSQQRLMRIAHRRVGKEEALLLANVRAEFLRPQVQKFLPQAGRRWGEHIKLRNDRLGKLALRVKLLLHIRPTVDNDIAKVAEDFGGAVAFGAEVEKFRGIVDECCRRIA